jgi:hypothetical protein
MPGVKGRSGRPGGNPDINKNPQTFKTDRAEPLIKQMQLRVSEQMWDALHELEGDWREFVREAIQAKLDEEGDRCDREE